MKKMLLLAVTLILTLLCSTAMAAKTVPQTIIDLFDSPAWEGYQIPKCTSEQDEYACFLCDQIVYDNAEDYGFGMVVMQKGDRNVLCLLEKKNGTWRITGRNHEALPRGNRVPYLSCDLYNNITIWGDEDENGQHTYMLELYRDDEGEWRFQSIEDTERNLDVWIDTDHLTYNVDTLYGEKTAYGVYDNRFEAFNWHYFPENIEEARERLSNPPSIPGNFLSPKTIDFRTGEKYDVFSAPGRDSYRPANGKAEMSTNDWVQVFGEEDGWLLVQYDISSDQMRFGYIDASALPRNTYVRSLEWTDDSYYTNRTTYLTDDPLNSCETLLRVPQGTYVRGLASLGTWIYVETETGGQTVRGFIPVEDVEIAYTEGK